MAEQYKIVKVGENRKLIREFIDFPKRLYKTSSLWVPMFDLDMRQLLYKKHPFFLHSEGEFFLLQRDGETVARSLVTENTRYNAHHKTNFAFFEFFDCIDDPKAAESLFSHLGQWASGRGCDALCGPMLSGGTYGTGILLEGFDHPPAMTMMRYNFSYYKGLLDSCGFLKYVDLNSFLVPPESLVLPERIRRLAGIVLKRGRFKVLRFRNKSELKKAAGDIKALYGSTLSHHLEDYPLSPEELDQIEKDLLTVADPELITVLTYDDRIVGYAFAFADITATLGKIKGRLGPLQILRLLSGMKKTKKVLFNGIGILPEYQRLGGNALMYNEMEKIVKNRSFVDVEMVQISEETLLMLSDARSLGGEPYKIHRLYTKRV
jgi:hypothetical protein